MKKLILSLTLKLLVLFSYGQELPCWTQPVPHEEIPRRIMREAQDDEQWTIGVVITVIGDQADQNLVNTAFIAEEIRLMNDAFGGRLHVMLPFHPVDCRIQFRLHRTRRVINDGSDFTAADHMAMYDPAKGGAAIDSPLYYTNLYYCNIDFAGGFSVFPRSNTVGSSFDGNVIRIQSILNHRLVNPHEVGHNYDLPHTFQPPQKGCGTHTTGDGDGIDDTPPIFGSTSGCPYGRLACFHIEGNPVNAQGQPLANVGNIMDYSSCEENFTEGQKDRMRAAILFYRPQLLSNQPPQSKYNCSNFNCVASASGAYETLTACQLACVESSTPFAKWLTRDTTLAPGTRIVVSCSVSQNTTRAEWWLNGILQVPFNSHMDVYSVGWNPQTGIQKSVFKVFNNQVFAFSDTLTITVGVTPPPTRYNCTSNACVGGSTGTYATLSACQQACITPPSKYDCVDGACIIATTGHNSLAECQAACGVENIVHTVIIMPDGSIKYIGCNGEIIKP